MMTTDVEADGHPRSTVDRVASWAFWLVAAGFVLASIGLARANNSPGSPDSCGNLVLGRNILAGRGFVCEAVGDLWIRRSIPFEDTTRPPALPYLIAAIFAASGPSLAVPVLVNAVAVLANALFLRAAVGRMAGRRRWLADASGLLVLLSYDYEMVSVWNNNILAAAHSALLWLAAGRPGRGRGRDWTWAWLAAWSAFGFLMKPTFLLGVGPFCLLVLWSEPGKTRNRRLAGAFAYLGLLLILTSPYWGRNLLRYGEPLYSPSFTSSRLAMRYNVLGDDGWRTVRFDRPMTYGEVRRGLGLANLLLVDAKMVAKTVLYSTLMNPGVVAVALGLLVFGRVDRWRDYAGAALLILGVGFEVGVYNHHEFRYTWPIYPCLIYLAALAHRDFDEWGVGQMSAELAGRSRRLLGLLWAVALLIGAFGALIAWREASRSATKPTPPWRSAVASLPRSAVVMAGDVATLAWWADRPAVIAPAGRREDLRTVLDAYKVDHFLETAEGPHPGRGVALRPDELEPVDRGEGWTLWRIRR